MVREVRHTATSPRIIDADDIDEKKGDIAICLCGLSPEYPFCDGSHRATRDEESDTVYRYENGDRREIEELVFADESRKAEKTGESDNSIECDK
ncbi:Iron-binding zinc finger CDGSH type [Haladaptatus litoreus]|uniref:Iron-binding zinc finger CDGSH type n=1 Tax=Haladaptatus litoreus TaxID=553468 RepID=A0A1N7E122_9EURY|nr:CDGSH iron-sulfur domain-containing protein [Haladaptatus litoreus]SIR81770.1 Iron-binding zinc finger CDGSH type [Haladaptatus litoreus]